MKGINLLYLALFLAAAVPFGLSFMDPKAVPLVTMSAVGILSIAWGFRYVFGLLFKEYDRVN